MKQYSVLSNIKLAEDAYILSFERDFDFNPGQVVEITTQTSIHPRMYSICSGNKSKTIDILYAVKHQGELTPCLLKLTKGEFIWVSQPKGNFLNNVGESVWIAAGTGIAPFISLIESDFSGKVMLIHGASSKQKLFFESTLTDKLGSSYFACCSKEPSDGLFHGRVTDFLNNYGILPLNIPYYVCGSAEMVVDTREILISKGVSYDKIFAEIYF